MTQFKVYRDGTKPMQERVRLAITHYYEQNKKLPAGIVVHKSALASELETARTAVKVLELSLTVEGNAGPLVGEVWLQVRGNNDKKAELQQAELFREEGSDG